MTVALQVGKKYSGSNGKKRTFGYRNVVYDDDGWADASLFYPHNYDLLYLKTSDGLKSGWKCPNRWDGLKIGAQEKVLLWKRKIEEH